jgi:short-subunit dehydrogenase
MGMNIKGKRILLTGADGGIGSALSAKLAASCADLVLCSHQPGPLEKLAVELKATGSSGAIVTEVANLSLPAERKRLATTCEAMGGIDVLINLAGVLDFNLYEDQAPEVIERTIAINLLAPMLLSREFLPQLKERDEATILNVGSIFASIGHPGFVAYCASKAGIKSFSESLGRELADTGIRVSYIAPRATATALNTDRVNAMNKQLGNKMDTPDYVAQQIVKQLVNGKTLSYLGWPEKLFVRINALLPTVVHKALVKNLGLIKQFASS